MDFKGKQIKFKLRDKIVIGIVTSHDLDTGFIVMHDMINAATLQPVKGKFGGIQIHQDQATLIDLTNI